MDIPQGRYRLMRLLDINDHFRHSPDAIILNKIDFIQPGYAKILSEKLYSRGSEMSFVASCDCGHYEGNFYINSRCPICNTIVRSPLSAGQGQLPHTAWLSIPNGIPGVLHPVFYTVLSKWLKCGKDRSYIDVILNPEEPLPQELVGVVTGRGFAYFYNNFDYLMEFFMGSIRKPTIEQARAKAKQIRRFIDKYRKIAFVNYLPALSSVLHPITSADSSANSRKYADKGSEFILAAAQDLSFMEFFPQKMRKASDVDVRVYSAYHSYMKYLSSIVTDRLSRKQSLLRRHMFGARYHWSFRSVIVPITGPHRYDELHLPWSVVVKLLKVHIMGRLENVHGMDVGAAASLHMRAEACYDPLVHQLINEFIAESPWPGLPVWFNRNPSIQRGAIQVLFVTKVKTNVEDKTIGISPLVLKPPNADFDKIPNAA